MKKQILFTMLLAMFAVASWGQTTQNDLETERIVEDHVYVIKNGYFRRMTSTTGPTESFYNAGLYMFYKVTGEETNGDGKTISFQDATKAYFIYCLTSGKWLSYSPKEPGYYQAGTNFVELVDDRKNAMPWCATYKAGFISPKDKYYTFQPYNSNQGATAYVYDYVVSTKYMNWEGSKANYPNDVADMTVGLSATFDKTTIGAAWTLRDMSTDTGATSYMTDLNSENSEFIDMVQAHSGSYIGQYTIDNDKFTAAKTSFDALVAKTSHTVQDIQAALGFLHNLRDACIVNGMQNGAYYKILSVAKSGYGIGMLTIENANEDGAEYSTYIKSVDLSKEPESPVGVWKYEEDANGAWLQNIYSGLYIQNYNNGNTNMGVDKDLKYKFSYQLQSVPDEDNEAKWRLYIGDQRLCLSSTSNSITLGQDTSALTHFFIERIKDDEVVAALPEKCVEWYKAHPKWSFYNQFGVEKLPSVPLLPKSDVDTIIYSMGMPDIKDVNTYNMYIDLDPNASDLSQEKIWQMYSVLPKQDAIMNAYADLLGQGLSISTDIITYTTPDAEYATACLPVRYQYIPGWMRYVSSAIKGNELILDTLDNNSSFYAACKPYILRLDKAQRGKKYQFVCYTEDTESANKKPYPEDGMLVGVLDGDIKCPISDDENDYYVLAKHRSSGKMGFYLVKTPNLTVTKYKCYLKIPKAQNAARYSFLFFKEDGDVETGIDNVLDTDVVQDDKQGNKQNGKIYNMSGQRLNRMQKGLNIVNGKIVIK